MTATTLKDMTVGETGTVAGYTKGASAYREKLLAMGLTRGKEIMVNLFDGRAGAFAYLLFILLYFPCVAAIAAVYRETNL